MPCMSVHAETMLYEFVCYNHAKQDQWCVNIYYVHSSLKTVGKQILLSNGFYALLLPF